MSNDFLNFVGAPTHVARTHPPKAATAGLNATVKRSLRKIHKEDRERLEEQHQLHRELFRAETTVVASSKPKYRRTEDEEEEALKFIDFDFGKTVAGKHHTHLWSVDLERSWEEYQTMRAPLPYSDPQQPGVLSKPVALDKLIRPKLCLGSTFSRNDISFLHKDRHLSGAITERSYRVQRDALEELQQQILPSAKLAIPLADPSSAGLKAPWHKHVYPDLDPVGRQSAVLLDKWLSEKLAALPDLDVRDTQTMSKMHHLFSLCMHEAVRQVSLHCSERGAVLARCWNHYCSLFDRVTAYHRYFQQKLLDDMELFRAEVLARVEAHAKVTQSHGASILLSLNQQMRRLDGLLDTEAGVQSKEVVENAQHDTSFVFTRLQCHTKDIVEHFHQKRLTAGSDASSFESDIRPKSVSPELYKKLVKKEVRRVQKSDAYVSHGISGPRYVPMRATETQTHEEDFEPLPEPEIEEEEEVYVEPTEEERVKLVLEQVAIDRAERRKRIEELKINAEKAFCSHTGIMCREIVWQLIWDLPLRSKKNPDKPEKTKKKKDKKRNTSKSPKKQHGRRPFPASSSSTSPSSSSSSDSPYSRDSENSEDKAERERRYKRKERRRRRKKGLRLYENEHWKGMEWYRSGDPRNEGDVWSPNFSDSSQEEEVVEEEPPTPEEDYRAAPNPELSALMSELDNSATISSTRRRNDAQQRASTYAIPKEILAAAGGKKKKKKKEVSSRVQQWEYGMGSAREQIFGLGSVIKHFIVEKYRATKEVLWRALSKLGPQAFIGPKFEFCEADKTVFDYVRWDYVEIDVLMSILAELDSGAVSWKSKPITGIPPAKRMNFAGLAAAAQAGAMGGGSRAISPSASAVAGATHVSANLSGIGSKVMEHLRQATTRADLLEEQAFAELDFLKSENDEQNSFMLSSPLFRDAQTPTAPSGGGGGPKGATASLALTKSVEARVKMHPGLPPLFTKFAAEVDAASDSELFQAKSVKAMLAIISAVYASKPKVDTVLDRSGTVRMEMPQYLIAYFMKKYGLEDVAGKQMKDFFTSLAVYVKSRTPASNYNTWLIAQSADELSLHTFLRFCGPFSPLPLGFDELNFFMFARALITKSIALPVNTVSVPLDFSVLMQFIPEILADFSTPDEWKHVGTALEAISQQRSGSVELAVILHVLLIQFQRTKARRMKVVLDKIESLGPSPPVGAISTAVESTVPREGAVCVPPASVMKDCWKNSAKTADGSVSYHIFVRQLDNAGAFSWCLLRKLPIGQVDTEPASGVDTQDAQRLLTKAEEEDVTNSLARASDAADASAHPGTPKSVSPWPSTTESTKASSEVASPVKTPRRKKSNAGPSQPTLDTAAALRSPRRRQVK